MLCASLSVLVFLPSSLLAGICLSLHWIGSVCHLRLSIPQHSLVNGGVNSSSSSLLQQQQQPAPSSTTAGANGNGTSWSDAAAAAAAAWVPSMGVTSGGHLALLLGDSGDYGDMSESAAGMDTGAHTPTSASGEPQAAVLPTSSLP